VSSEQAVGRTLNGLNIKKMDPSHGPGGRISIRATALAEESGDSTDTTGQKMRLLLKLRTVIQSYSSPSNQGEASWRMSMMVWLAFACGGDGVSRLPGPSFQSPGTFQSHCRHLSLDQAQFGRLLLTHWITIPLDERDSITTTIPFCFLRDFSLYTASVLETVADSGSSLE
jgi:hypothetical protein